MRQVNAFFTLTFLLCIYWILMFNPINYKAKVTIGALVQINTAKRLSPARKIVVFWTSFMGEPHQVEKALNGCPNQHCLITNNRSLIADADAVIFHVRNIDYSDLPETRTINQRYVFLLMESPILTFNSLSGNDNFFNWTMTYRRDSDIYYPYGMISKRHETIAQYKGIESQIRAKTKLVAWLVSHCFTHSKREKVVAKLQEYIPVDIYGRCGPLKCTENEKCQRIIETNYKFYIAFENAICTDYITEKFFHIVRLTIVPIVLKRLIYEGIVPADSFIAVDDFSSVAQLTDYLLYLDRNGTAYREYFHWKRDFQIVNSSNYGFCALCRALNSEMKTKWYRNIKHWWYNKGSCLELSQGNVAEMKYIKMLIQYYKGRVIIAICLRCRKGYFLKDWHNAMECYRVRCVKIGNKITNCFAVIKNVFCSTRTHQSDVSNCL